jgi:hypothetical protein
VELDDQVPEVVMREEIALLRERHARALSAAKHLESELRAREQEFIARRAHDVLEQRVRDDHE